MNCDNQKSLIQRRYDDGAMVQHNHHDHAVPYPEGLLARFKSTHLADYLAFTALGQPTTKASPKPEGGVVASTYTYIPETGRLKKLETTLDAGRGRTKLSH